MAFDVKKLFGKKNKKPEDEVDFEDLGDKEKPESIVDKIKPELPEGTNIEPKVLIGVGLVICFILTFVIANGLSGTEKEEQEKDAAAQSSRLTPSRGGLPDELGKMPNDYSAIEKPNPLKEPLKEPAAEKKNVQIRPIAPMLGNQMPYTNPRSLMLNQANAYMMNQQSREEKELEDALRSGLRFGVLSSREGSQNTPEAPQPYGVELMSAPTGGQNPKERFIEENSRASSFYVRSPLQAPISEYEVKAGTIIPGVLITGINSDLPGQIVAQVRENVYDTVSGDYLLIPQGAKLIGKYDSNLTYAQDRVLIVWNRLIMPNGESQDLEGMPGADMAGNSGFTGRKNNHVPRILNSVVLGSLLTAGARIATGGISDEASFSQLAGRGTAENIADAATRITERNLDIQPTIEISPGYVFNVFVNKDLILKPYQG